MSGARCQVSGIRCQVLGVMTLCHTQLSRRVSASVTNVTRDRVVTDVNPSSGDIIKLTITPGVLTPRRKSRSAGSKIASVGLPVLVG